MPDKLVVATSISGPGYVMDGAADAGAFQLRWRGPQDDQPAAETLAYLMDRLIFNASFPAFVDGGVLIHVHRLGGSPSPLLPSPDSGDRYELTCAYVAIFGAS